VSELQTFLGLVLLPRVTIVRLLGGRAYVRFFHPFAIDLEGQCANDGTAGYQLVAILPAADAEDAIEALHDGAGIHVSRGESVIA
jgi:hypothetical protein